MASLERLTVSRLLTVRRPDAKITTPLSLALFRFSCGGAAGQESGGQEPGGHCGVGQTLPAKAGSLEAKAGRCLLEEIAQ